MAAPQRDVCLHQLDVVVGLFHLVRPSGQDLLQSGRVGVQEAGNGLHFPRPLQPGIDRKGLRRVDQQRGRFFLVQWPVDPAGCCTEYAAQARFSRRSPLAYADGVLPVEPIDLRLPFHKLQLVIHETLNFGGHPLGRVGHLSGKHD